jgi:tRNA 2-thiocytidine biosynthesis protein TtcA
VETMSRALGDIRPSQLSDPKLFDFLALGKRGETDLPDAHAWLAGTPHADAGVARDEPPP